jgi:hypothetical protein
MNKIGLYIHVGMPKHMYTHGHTRVYGRMIYHFFCMIIKSFILSDEHSTSVQNQVLGEICSL